MVKFTTDELRRMMDVTPNIRNMSVIAHVDHGKTTLTDNLVAAAGIIAEENSGKTTYTMTRKDELARGITIKSTAISLYFEANSETTLPEGSKGKGFLFNLIDSPGHVDFSSEVTAALRITDGALVVVDTIDGVCVQTETVLRQAITERIKPVLVVNKVDRALLELKLDAETIYQKFAQAIESANVVIGLYKDDTVGDWLVDPTKGTVAFGSGLHGWFFTLGRFAKMYAAKFNVDPQKMLNRLWGDNYFDVNAKKWKKAPTAADGTELQRAFCQFIMDPIVKLSRAVMEEDNETVVKILTSQNITLKADEQLLPPKQKLKMILKKWLPATEALMEMMIVHLPSPLVAQKYRVDCLYTGATNDKYAEAIRSCNPNGPLMIYVSKMVPSADRGHFYAVGRVFSGTVKTSHKVRIMGANYSPGSKEDLYLKSVQRPVLLMGRTTELLGDCPCGNIIGLSGIDQFLVKSGTLTDQDCADAFPFKAMKFSVSPVVRVAVAPKNAADLPKLVEGLKRLANSDPLCQCYTEESGEHIVAGCGELHIEICIQDLREEFCSIDLKVSDPVVSFRETVTELSNQVVLAKSANKHNRLFMQALPFAEGLSEAIESGEIDLNEDNKIVSRTLADKYDWDIGEARKIWCFGPDTKGTNCFVDTTKSCMYLNEIKDSIIGGFQWVAKEGPLCEEQLRGVRFNLLDVLVHPDAPHHSGAQIIPTAKRCLNGSVLTAQPRLLEPVFLVDITCPESCIGGVYAVMNKRHGRIISDEQKEGTPLHRVQCYLPVLDSFGFNADLRENTSGKAFPQCVFDHWEIVAGDPKEPKTRANDCVRSVRKRKGLNEEIPELTRFIDKL